ncbi:MAG: hypothetical protein ACOYN3_10210, partial [Acidimicrobiia bacterium]
LKVKGTSANSGTSAKWKWYEVAGNGKYEICTDATKVCVHYAWQAADGSTGSSTNDYIVEVTSRAKCLGATLDNPTGRVTNGAKCVLTRYQQRMRKKQFFDYLSFTNSEQLAAAFNDKNPPSPGAPVPYTAGDVLDGPVRSNGQFAICSTISDRPWFKEGLFTKEGNTGFDNDEKVTGTGCKTPTFYSGSGDSRESKTTATKTDTMSLPTSTSKLGEIGTPVEADHKVVTLCPGGYIKGAAVSSTCTNPTPYPASGVLYSESRANYLQVTGTYSGKLTIATAPGVDIEIVGDLKRYNSDPMSTDVLGLISGSDIIIQCGSSRVTTYDTVGTNPTAGQAACFNSFNSVNSVYGRTIEAAMLALGTDDTNAGWIGVDKWATGGMEGGTVPTLNFVGTMASKFRGVFGAYDAEKGSYERGYKKTFTFDTRLKNIQPPFFLEPTTATWERLDLTEIPPCSTGLNGDTPSNQGGGC